MRPAKVAAGPALCKLTVAVGLQTADLCLVILGCRSIFQEIFKCLFSMSLQRLCQDQPSLRLREDTGIFFYALIIDHCQSAVEGMSVIRRIHKDGSVLGIETFMDIFHDKISLVFGSQAADHCPALRIQPEVSLRIFGSPDPVSGFGISPDKAVFVPAQSLDLFSHAFLSLFQKTEILVVFFMESKFLH